ncbi:MAG: hypothetical protein KDA27_02795 [Candidatus Eisenbacteria bacterium]|uniref:Uncharacterized protein n=1 Tax=Eiseniibacteriota bacterium TaxID=2212470 RepID=A0A956SDV8_UNCEI|nr:hypothetical protein [Candidatus Eisenbacteria bacterium]MCB9464905.1 hypothetical protein [Candidatus Eisenbacteria bacterium]
MASIRDTLPIHPSRATWIASGLVLLGFSFLQVHPVFLLVIALGAFGPGLLRTLGWLHDQDEFQRRAAERAGYLAYLVTGLVGFALLALLGDGSVRSAAPDAILQTVLSLLWFTWLISSLVSYWGAHKTARRLLIAFGLVWLAFNVVGHLAHPMELLMQSLLAVPFLLAAWLVPRWPRVVGVLLLGLGAFFSWLFHLYEIVGPTPLALGRGVVLILFVGPLLASGIALLRGAD